MRGWALCRIDTHATHRARYSGASGDWYIENDDSLKAALADSERSKKAYLRVVLTQGKTAGAGAAPAAAAAAPAHVERSAPAPAYHAPAQHSAPAPAAAPAPAPSQPSHPGSIAHFTLPGSGSADRIKIEAQQTAEYFLFTPVPSKYQTDVTVVLEATKLVYHNQYTFQDGAQLKTMNLTQTFNLPFAPSPDQVSVSGNQVKLLIPQ